MKFAYQLELLTICLGVLLMILSLSFVFDLVELSSALITGFSITGTALAMIDMVNMFLETDRNKRVKKVLQGLTIILFGLAAFGILIFPYISIIQNMLPANIEKMNDISSIFALGIAITLIGLRNRISMNRELNELRQGYLESLQSNVKFSKELTQQTLEISNLGLNSIQKLANRVTELEEEKQNIENMTLSQNNSKKEDKTNNHAS
jgi:glucan phosphoethanolaminetransferase (alkaline phosphatase superfamily)